MSPFFCQTYELMKYENDKYKLSGSRFYTKCNRKLLEQNAPMIEDSLSLPINFIWNSLYIN